MNTSSAQRLRFLCFAVIVFYFCIALLSHFGVLFQSFNITQYDLIHAPPSNQHWLGTDAFGRDLLARVIHGTYTSLLVGVCGAGLSLMIGSLLGALSGYFGGKIDAFIVWLYSTIDTIPYILLLAALSLVMGHGLMTLITTIGLTSWVSLCRILRAEFKKQKTRDYVQSARSLGIPPFRQIFFHIFPNLSHILFIYFSLGFISAIKSEVILSYLGLGVEPGTPSWGLMINDAIPEVSNGIWWGLASVILAMFPITLAFYLLNQTFQKTHSSHIH